MAKSWFSFNWIISLVLLVALQLPYSSLAQKKTKEFQYTYSDGKTYKGDFKYWIYPAITNVKKPNETKFDIIVQDLSLEEPSHKLKIVFTYNWVESRKNGAEQKPNGLTLLKRIPKSLKASKPEKKVTVAEYTLDDNTINFTKTHNGDLWVGFKIMSEDANVLNKTGRKLSGKDYSIHGGAKFKVSYTLVVPKTHEEIVKAEESRKKSEKEAAAKKAAAEKKAKEEAVAKKTLAEKKAKEETAAKETAVKRKLEAETALKAAKAASDVDKIKLEAIAKEADKRAKEAEAARKKAEEASKKAEEEANRKLAVAKAAGEKEENKIKECNKTPLKIKYNRFEDKKNIFVLEWEGHCDFEVTYDYQEGISFSRINDNSIKVTITDNKSHDILFSVIKYYNKESQFEVHLSPSSIYDFSASMLQKGNVFQIIDIKNGEAPYKLEFYILKDGLNNGLRYVHELDEESEKLFVDLAKLVKESPQLHKDKEYEIRVFSASGQQNETDDITIISVKTNLLPYIIGGSIALLLLVIGYVLYWSNKKREREENEEKIREKLDPKPSVSDNDIIINPRPKPEPKLQPNIIVSNHKYYEFDLSDIWSNSIVKNIQMSDIFAVRLDDFVFDENKTRRISGGVIPEIGGFILDQKVFNKSDNTYTLKFERFVNIEPENQNVYQIKFGVKAAFELDRQLEVYRDKNLELLGWFHTHPGHGLFLSSPDLTIHQSQMFNQPYMVAMELDSVQKMPLNPNYSFTMFTRQQSGEINNKENRIKDWWEWKTIQRNFLKKKV